MNNPNFSRRLLMATIEGRVYLHPELARLRLTLWEKLNKFLPQILLESKKFILPEGGILLEDHDLRALENIEQLGLPYENFCLEFVLKTGDGSTDSPFIRRNVVVITFKIPFPAHGCDTFILTFSSVKEKDAWLLWNVTLLNTKNCIRRDEKNVSIFEKPYVDNDSVLNGTYPVLSMVNALACKNVSVEKSPSNAKGKALKNPYPFEDYHFLTVAIPGRSASSCLLADADRRRPREHIRRGHIRQIESGPVWVNSAIVNHGVGGRIDKAYIVRPS